MNVPLISAIQETIKGIFGFVDDLHTSEEEKLTLKSQMFLSFGTLMQSAMEYEKSILQMKVDVITAEAKGESWLQRNWRPMVMLFFMILVGAYWFGFVPDNLSSTAIENLFLLVQIGLGGYVVGRSAEKISKNMTGKGLVDLVSREKE